MKNPELFHKTVGILVNAYFNDVLISGDCHACAVGNIVAANCGYSIQEAPNRYYEWIDKKGNLVHVHWVNVFYTSVVRFFGIRLGIIREFDSDNIGIREEKEILSTGYNVVELAKIESAFECGQKGFTASTRMFNGIIATVDALIDIHNGSNLDRAEAKQLFKKELTEIG